MMKYLYIFVILINPHVGFSQNSSDYDTILYYSFKGDFVSNRDSASSVEYLKYDSLTNRYDFRSYYLGISHGFIEKGQLLSFDPRIRDGIFKRFDYYGNSVNLEYRGDSLVQITSYKDKEGNDLTPVYAEYDLDRIAYYKIQRWKGYKEISDSIQVITGNTRRLVGIIFTVEIDGSISNIQLENYRFKEHEKQITKYLTELRFTPAILNEKHVRQLVRL